MTIQEILEELIRIPSTHENPEALKTVVDRVEGWLGNLPLVRRFERKGKHSLYVAFEERRPRVLFVGHLDVVPAQVPSQFEPRVEGNKLYGRGALDMKGPCAAMIHLFQKLSEEGKTPPIALLLTTDEEVGSENGVAWLVREHGMGGDFVIVPDGGSNFRLIYEEKGALHLRVHARGRGGHGSMPWVGENALDTMIQAYLFLRGWIATLERPDDRDHWHPTLNLGKMEGGQKANVIPDQAWMDLDFRFPGPVTVEDWERTVRSLLSRVGSFDVEVLTRAAPVKTDPNHPLFISFRKTAERVLGREVELAREHGATDARYFAEAGMPVVVLYPVGGNIHEAGEWVDLISLERLEKIFWEFVGDLT